MPVEVTKAATGKIRLKIKDQFLGPDEFKAYTAKLRAHRAIFDPVTKSNILDADRWTLAKRDLNSLGLKIVGDEEFAAVEDAQEDRVLTGRLTKLAGRGLRLYPFQKEAVAWLRPKGSALLASDPGTGKSCQALISGDLPMLIICPAVAKGVWQREIGRWLTDSNKVVSVISGKGNFRWPEDNEIIITNYDILPDESDVPEDVPASVTLICDEAHAVKNTKAARTKKVKAISKLVRGKGGRCWLLTGTPLLNKPPELWSLFSVMGKAESAFKSWRNFMRVFGGEQGRFGIEWNGGISTAEVLNSIKPYMLRHRKEEVLHDLPEKRIDTLVVDITKQDYKELAKYGDLKETLQGLVAETIPFTPDTIGELSNLRKELAKVKLPALMALLDEQEETGEPCVVFSAHVDPLKELVRSRDGWGLICGDTPHYERTQIENDFQAGKLKGLAGTIQAMGVAITLTRASRAIFLDCTWTPALNLQAEDRLHRVGQRNSIVIDYLIANHQLDEMVMRVVDKKRQMVGASIDAEGFSV